MMKNLFEQSRSHWVRYDYYELKTAEDGKRLHHPRQECKAGCLQSAERGPQHCAGCPECRDADDGTQAGSRSEKGDNGVYHPVRPAGLMTALPTTPSFMTMRRYTCPKNHFIKEESMATDNTCPCFILLTSWTW